MNYIIKIPQFEGPFDLLLELVEKKKVEITDIKISEIAEDYLIALKKMEDLDIGIASDFLRLAGNLLQLKSRSLIPSTTHDWDGIYHDYLEEEMGMFENEEDLKMRLMEYRIYKDAAVELMKFEEERSKSFERYEFDEITSFSIISKEKFIEISAEILQLMTEEDDDFFIDDFDTIYLDEITVEEKMEFVVQILKQGNNFNKFSQLLNERANKSEVVATFLALLELSKSGLIKINQDSNFEEITIDLEEK